MQNITEEVIDPPIIGFDLETINRTTQEAYKHNLIVQLVENSINLRTSTPLSKKKQIWDVVVKHHYLQVMKMSKRMDSDSGYASNNHESNSSTHAEICSYEEGIIPKFVYVNEDTLLEQPQIQINSNDSRVEASVSSTEQLFRTYQDTVESGISESTNTSPVIAKISPIIVTNSNLNKRKFCEISEDSPAEHNVHHKNSRGSTLLELSLLSKTEETKEMPEVTLINIAQTPEKIYKNQQNSDMSPDLFSDEDNVEATQVRAPKITYKEKYLLRQDRKLLRRAQDIMIGVSPPASVKYVHMSVDQLLEKIDANKSLFLVEDDVVKYRENAVNKAETFLVTEHGKDSVLRDWPEVLEERFHGLHFNRNKTSEELEQLAMKYSSKYIGCETQSFCTVFQTNRPTPSKNANQLRWAIKSPGKRLSHLARRRITFSSANIQSQTRQVTMDPGRLKLLSRKKSPLKKSPRKTPRKSPRKSPTKKIRTPSSSAKKRLSMQLRIFAEQMPSTSKVSATKRALFQSPDKGGSSSQSKQHNPGMPSGTVAASPFKRGASLRCALFASPTKKESPSKAGCKRKRTDSDTVHPAKLPRSLSLQENATCNSSNKLSRVRSDAVLPSAAAANQRVELSANHKKKLQWAIFEALRSQNIGMAHPEFKRYASVLVRVTRKFLPNLSANAPRPECGTSERMLRIARQHVTSVIAGKSVEEIISEFERNKLKNSRPMGYVSIEEAAKRMDISDAKTNVLRDMVNIPQAPKPEIKKLERIDKVRKIINFDEDNSVR